MRKPPTVGASKRPIRVAELYQAMLSPRRAWKASATAARATGPRMAVARP